MKVYRDIDHLPSFRNAVLTIGTFDGVHKGHQQIIHAMRSMAKEADGETIIITFNPHPRKIVRPETSLEMINTLDEKIHLIERHGIDHLVIVPFTEAFAQQDAHDYIHNFLVERFHPKTIIIGYDHHFGKNRTGNFDLLAKLADTYRYQLLELPKHVIDQIAISSTEIRNALWKSDVDTANKLLGYDFFFSGTVVHGDALGRKLGYPTANLVYNDADKIHMGQGVFAVQVRVKDKLFNGMLSIGSRPTVNGFDERIEVNIFDFDEDIYGESITVILKKYLRPQEKYATLDELIRQLAIDKQDSLKCLNPGPF
jgi:riboflavin kinase/FMN adenylyltransferase